MQLSAEISGQVAAYSCDLLRFHPSAGGFWLLGPQQPQQARLPQQLWLNLAMTSAASPPSVAPQPRTTKTNLHRKGFQSKVLCVVSAAFRPRLLIQVLLWQCVCVIGSSAYLHVSLVQESAGSSLRLQTSPDTKVGLSEKQRGKEADLAGVDLGAKCVFISSVQGQENLEVLEGESFCLIGCSSFNIPSCRLSS